MNLHPLRERTPPVPAPSGGVPAPSRRTLPRVSLLRSLLVAGAVFVVATTSADGTPAWLLLRGFVILVATGIVLVGLRSGPAWMRIALLTVAGVLGCVVGAGIGIPHLVKEYNSGEGLLALGALGCSLALVIAGIAQCARAVRSWRKVLAVVVALVAAEAIWTLAPAFAATNVPRTMVGNFTPAHNGFSYSDVVLPTSDGALLAGWYIASRNGAAVVMLHGSGSTRSSTLAQASVLARHGYGVLLVDARGHGGSTGRAMDFGWYGDRDVAAAVRFLTLQPDVDPERIGAVGLSMGGEEAIGAAATDTHIRAVVAEGATARTAADKATWLPSGLLGMVQRGLDRVTYGVADALTDARAPISLRAAAIAARPRPILLITAGRVADETRAARSIAAAARTVQIWNVAGADHTGGLAAQPDAWENTVIGFLDRSLR